MKQTFISMLLAAAGALILQHRAAAQFECDFTPLRDSVNNIELSDIRGPTEKAKYRRWNALVSYVDSAEQAALSGDADSLAKVLDRLGRRTGAKKRVWVRPPSADNINAALTALYECLYAPPPEEPPVDNPPVENPPVDNPPIDTPPINNPPVNNPPVENPPVTTPPTNPPPTNTPPTNSPPVNNPPVNNPPVNNPPVDDPSFDDPPTDPELNDSSGCFKRLLRKNNAAVVLEPDVYGCKLVVRGNATRVNGSTDGETIIEGDVLITGNQNYIRNLTVTGTITIKGDGNQLINVWTENAVVDTGERNSY